MNYTFQFGPLLNYLPQVVSGLWLTLVLSFVGIFGGIALGVASAVLSTSPWKPGRLLVRIYVEVTRNTPLQARPSYDEELERRIAGMRAFLLALEPDSDAEALRLLREAFPDLPLAERVKACSGWRS